MSEHTQWTAGEEPWVRRTAPAGLQSSTRDGEGVLCMFCGGQTVKISVSDISEDTGRVRLYCDATDCDAREMTLLVERDGNRAHERADVRALRALDEADPIGNAQVHTGGLLTKKPGYGPAEERLARRLSREPLDLLIP